MNRYIIQEAATISPITIKREKNPNVLEFVATIQEADNKNRNGRIYYKKVLEEGIASPYVQERLRTKTLYCESGHPLEQDIRRQMSIDQRNIAAIITEMWWEGNLLKAKVETANTAAGRDMKGLIEQGSIVAFSLRAQGNVHRDPISGAQIVESPIQILGWDWVVNPSHDKAFMDYVCESTYNSLFKGRDMVSLNESEELFENGKLISLDEQEEAIIYESFTANFGNKLKKYKDCYRYEEGDKLVGVSNDKMFATVVNGNVEKKVFTEDYVLKNIRHLIKNI